MKRLPMKRLPIILAWLLLLIGLSIDWMHRPKPQMLVPDNDPHVHHPPNLPDEAPAPTPPKTAPLDAHDDVMQIAVSTILLGACLFVILAKRYQPADKHWALHHHRDHCRLLGPKVT